MKWWVGFVTGALVMLAAGVLLAPRAMLREDSTPLSLEAAVSAITNEAVSAGWVVSSVLPLDETVRRHGGDPGRPVRVIKLCRADHAGAVLRDDRAASRRPSCRARSPSMKRPKACGSVR